MDKLEEKFFEILEGLIGKPLARRNQLMRSPFRQDKKPSFSIFKYSGTWFFKDFSTGEAGTVVHLLCKMLGVTVSEAMRMLEEPLKKTHFVQHINKEQIEADYSVSKFVCSFKEEGYEGSYLQAIGISKKVCEMNEVKFGTFKTSTLSYNNAVLYENIESINQSIECANKYYFPNNKNVRFLGNKKWHHLFGSKSLKHLDKPYAFISAGEKDGLVLQTVFNTASICFNSETYLPNIDMLSFLKELNKHFVVVYDNDETGYKFSDKLCSLLASSSIKVTECRIPDKYKDVTDMFVEEKNVFFTYKKKY